MLSKYPAVVIISLARADGLHRVVKDVGDSSSSGGGSGAVLPVQSLNSLTSTNHTIADNYLFCYSV